MKAVVKYEKAPGKVELTDVPVPEIGDDEVLIRVEIAGVCGTDVHIYHDRYDTVVPLILGHEFAGRIVQTGPQVAGWKIGDRVVVENNPYACGKCRACRLESPNICPEKKAIGFRSDGCFAEFIKVPAGVLHHIPNGLSDRSAALTEPVAVAVHAVSDRGNLRDGDVVAILGPGPIGLAAAQVALATGAKDVTVIGTDRDRRRLEVATEIGVRSLQVSEGDAWREAINEADLVIEASGSTRAIQEVFRMVNRAARIVPVGIIGTEPVEIPWNFALNMETTVAFSYSSRPGNWETALSLLAGGKIAEDLFISCEFSIEQWRNAIEETERGQCVKVLLRP